MNEEQKPVDQPSEPKTPEVQPETKESTLAETTKLESLPDHMKEVLNSLIRAGYGSQRTKVEFEKKFGAFSDILPASRTTYQAYINAHYDELTKDLNLERETVSSIREGSRRAVGLVESVLGGDNSSIREQLESLKEFMLSRIEFIEQAQSLGIPSAQLENTMSSYVTGIRNILEKSIEYGQELNREEENQVELYLEGLIQEFVTNCVGIYKNIHGDNKLQEFSIALETKLAEILKAALQEKVRDDGKQS